MPRIFISYRRDDSRDVVGRIADWLRLQYGESNIFTDVYNITPGTDFRGTLEAAVLQCDVLLAIIGPQWTGQRPGADTSRILDESDWVRAELELGFKNQVPIIPVLIGDAMLPEIDQLPKSLATLHYLQAARIRPDPDFRTDIMRLRDAIAVAERQRRATLAAQTSPISPPSVSVATPIPQPVPHLRKTGIGRRIALVLCAILVIILACVGLITPQIISRASANAASFAETQTAEAHGTATSVAKASATVQALQTLRTQPYNASPAPGADCDKSGAIWTQLMHGTGSGGTCLGDSYQLPDGIGSSAVFQWYDGLKLPSDQTVSVRIKILGSQFTDPSLACGGIALRATQDTLEYLFIICRDGSWRMTRFPGAELKDGRTSAADTYNLTVSCIGSRQALAINGTVVGQTNDATIPGGGSEINLVGYGYTVLVSDFTFTPG